MNKRSAPRFPVTLDVAVTFPGDVYRVCTIRDYCAGGMYLLCTGTSGGSISVTEGDMLHIEFSNPLRAQRDRYLLTGHIARIAENGFGVAFEERNPAAIAALSQLAESQAAASREAVAALGERREINSKEVTSAIKECQARSELYLGQVLQAFYTRANDALFDKAGEAKSNTLQSAYFGAMNELRKMQVEISQNFLSRFSEQFAILGTTGYQSPFSEKSQPASELSLVDSDELDNWLAVRAMAAKLEEHMADTLEALEARFEKVSANPITLESNPVGPFVIASVFREAVNSLVLEEAARATLYEVMEALLQERLIKLYDELNAFLIERDIMPNFTKKLEVVRPGGDTTAAAGMSLSAEKEEMPELEDIDWAPAYRRPHGNAVLPTDTPPVRASATVPTEENPERHAAGITDSRPITGANNTPATAPALTAVSYARSSAAELSRSDGREGNVSSEEAASAASPVASSYQGLKVLMGLQHPGTKAENESPPSGYFSGGEIIQALGRFGQGGEGLKREELSTLDPVQSLSQQLDEISPGSGKNLSPADREKVTFIGGMFSSILQDHLVPMPARPWFSQLEVPLLKAGLLDDRLMEDESHPARIFMNRLESIGDLIDENDSPRGQQVRERIEGILGDISENVEHDANVFADAIDELDNVEEQLKESYEDNVAKLIQELERETTLNRARQAILEALNHRLGQREVPSLVLMLLDIGWKNLLLRTYIKSGAESSTYQTYLHVVDQLYARLMETMPYSRDAAMSDQALLEWLERLLSKVSSDEAKRSDLLGDIRQRLTGEATTPLRTQYVPALVSKMLHREQHAEAEKPSGVEEDIWQLMLLDAGELQDGEAFSYCDPQKSEIRVTLVWRDEQEPRYVFVDNAGHKQLDINLGETANLLYRKVLTRLDEKSLSVTERATYHFLQSLHNRLAYQAQHDELTGLLNRKAFEKELEEAFLSAKSGTNTHVLGYLDLDRFNVINTTCGHAEGDILLGKVAQVIQDTLNEDVVLARLGGDEFGILLKNCRRSVGLKLITEVHDAIRNMRFSCENNEFKVTASIGLAEINETGDSSGRLLSAVDAATFTAKDMGRDNIQIYNAENELISNRRNILDWVGRINVLFDKNLIQLRCQKIKPLHPTINSLPYYEVLLDVMDEEGNKVPLDEFIVAAERYNRIIDIDTWVVDYVTNWMQDHRDKLDRVSAISINLSGSSLGNRKFMEHTESRLSQSGFPADKVCFEVTETIAINNLDNASRFMRKLKETGCLFSLDDFGTGTSSYSYLKSLPIDYLKIDGAFVKDIATNSNDYAVVKSINEIGHAMGKKTVAEYVESEFAYEALKQIGLDYAQGFAVEKPIPLFKLFG